MYSLAPPGNAAGGTARDWSLEDLEAIEREAALDTPPERLDQYYYGGGYELLQCLQVTPEKIPQCVKDLPRLKDKSWYLTKHVWTFQPEEMHDLEFQPAIPLLAATLPDRAGGTAAGILPQLGPTRGSGADRGLPEHQYLAAHQCLLGPPGVRDPDLVEPLLTLLRDEVPRSPIQRRHGRCPELGPAAY